MQLLELMKQRRSTRLFTDRAISDADLLRLVDAGRWAPSGSNRQPCRFVVSDDPALVDSIRAFTPGITVGKPAAVMTICVDQRTRSAKEGTAVTLDHMDVAMAAQNVLLLAHSMGIGSCAVLSFDPATISRLLNLPDHITPELLVTLGYPKAPPRVRPRKRIADILHRNTYGQPFHGAEAYEDEVGAPAPQAPPVPEQPPASEAQEAPAPCPTPAAAAPGSATVGLEEKALKVLAHALVSVKLLVNEPPHYGPRRILDIVARLSSALDECGLAREAARAVSAEIERARAHGLMADQGEMMAIVNRSLPAVEKALADKAGSPAGEPQP